jgi:hypothetical protein
LHRQVSRFLAFEDAIDIGRGAPKIIKPVGSVGQQAAGGDERAFEVDRGQFVSGRQRDDQIAMTRRRPLALAQLGQSYMPGLCLRNATLTQSKAGETDGKF